MTRAAERLPADELDPRLGRALHDRLPGLRAALDPAAMRDQVAAALHARHPVEACVPEQTSYLGDSCLVRYAVRTAGRDWTVTGRVFPDAAGCATYLATRLEPLAEPAAGPTAPGFGRPVGAAGDGRVALSVFPVDGELPALVTATDPAAMLPVLETALRGAYDPDLTVTGCTVEPGHYGRAHRCVLRYRVTLAGSADPLLVYGKAAADDRGEQVEDVVGALRPRVAGVVALPRVLGYLPELRLGLFTALPGTPQVAQLVRARLRTGPPVQDRAQPSLEAALASCARTAAALHGSGLAYGPPRTFAAEAAALRRSFALVRPLAPGLADRLEGWLAAAAAGAGAADPLVLSHGDFSYTQLIFDGPHAGLVDFDTLCQAEPALDLGHFLAYLDLAARKPGSVAPGAVDRLRAAFLSSYAQVRAVPERLCRYETVSLLRLAAHSWAKFKPKRLRLVLDALDTTET